ncbi:unnamed protein product [Camellia sinensis]
MQPFCLGCYFGYAEVHAGTSEDTVLIIVITPECNVEWLLQLVLLEGLTLLRYQIINDYDYVCVENGLVAYKDGKLIGTQSLRSYLGEEKLKEFINFTLHYIADLDIPIKSGMLNVSPIGRNCSQEERDEFGKYDKVTSLEDTVKQCTALFLSKQVDVY